MQKKKILLDTASTRDGGVYFNFLRNTLDVHFLRKYESFWSHPYTFSNLKVTSIGQLSVSLFLVPSWKLTKLWWHKAKFNVRVCLSGLWCVRRQIEHKSINHHHTGKGAVKKQNYCLCVWPNYLCPYVFLTAPKRVSPINVW